MGNLKKKHITQSYIMTLNTAVFIMLLT